MGENNGSEKRKYPRFQMQCSGLVVMPSDVRAAEIEDISKNGALLTLHFPASAVAGNTIKLHFYDRETGTFCSVDAVAVRAFNRDGREHVAITFEDDITTISKILDTYSKK